MQQEIKLGKYVDSKGNFFEVIAIAKHHQTFQELVVYEDLNKEEESDDVQEKNNYFVMEKELFIQNIQLGDKLVPRFRFIDDDPYTYQEN